MVECAGSGGQARPLLFVIDYFRDPNAGTEGQLVQLIEGLDRSRFEPHLLVFNTSDYLERHGFPCPVTVLGRSSLTRPAMWWSLYRIARHQYRRGVRLAHIYFNDASVIGPPVFALAGIKTIISRRDMGYWYTPVYRRLLRITRRFVSLAIVNSRAVGDVVVAAERIPAAQIRVIHNGYHPQPAEDAPVPELEQIRQQGQPMACLVANIRPIKRMQDAIEAVARLKRQGLLMHLVIIGAGDATALRQLAEHLAVSERIHFAGARSDVQRCLGYFDAALLCSESEGFSNAIVEYQYAGLPVVCTDTGGNPEAIVAGETGWLYPVGDVAALARLLGTLIGDAERRRAMGEAAARRARERFSVTTMVAEHEQIYTELLEH